MKQYVEKQNELQYSKALQKDRTKGHHPFSLRCLDSAG